MCKSYLPYQHIQQFTCFILYDTQEYHGFYFVHISGRTLLKSKVGPLHWFYLRISPRDSPLASFFFEEPFIQMTSFCHAKIIRWNSCFIYLHSVRRLLAWCFLIPRKVVSVRSFALHTLSSSRGSHVHYVWEVDPHLTCFARLAFVSCIP